MALKLPYTNHLLRSVFFSVFLLKSLFSLHGQSAKQYAQAGEKSIKQADYVQAQQWFEKATEVDPQNISHWFNLAESYRLNNQYVQAEHAYQKVILHELQTNYPTALFWLACMQKSQAKYAEASINFSKAKSNKSMPSNYLRKAKNEINICLQAEQWIKDSLRIEIKNLGESLNSEGAEFAFFPNTSEEALLSVLRAKEIEKNQVVKDRVYQSTIYKAKQTEGEWTLEESLPKIINNAAYDQANASVSQDGNRLYFSRCDELGSCQIFMSKKQQNAWQDPELLDVNINPEGSSNTQPHITQIKGKEYLFFTSTRTGGKGGFDIWYSQVSEQGNTYAIPKNAGKKVNTPDHEITPFYDHRNECLYFSSNWHAGIGGYDIFKSCGELKSLGIPENLGVPINSPANDLYFSKIDSTHGFLTSNREGSVFSNNAGTCCNDIYSFRLLPEPIDSIKESTASRIEKLNLHLPVLYFHNDEPNPKSLDTLTSLSYTETYEKYTAMLEKYQQEYAQGLSKEEEEIAHQDMEDFFNLQVDQGVRDLQVFCEHLQKELQRGEKILITIKGYASPLAKTDYNVNLTLRRISSLVNYLRLYRNGELIPYLEKTATNGGSIDFEKIPFGEYKSDSTVSDNLNDTRNSVYSKKAALERKIEVLSVKIKN